MPTYYALTPTASMTVNSTTQSQTIGNIRNAFLSCSFTRIPSSGSIDDLTTLSTSSTAGIERTFDMFAFNDSWQATHPLFIRIGYRTDGSQATTPHITFQMGNSHNNSGSFNGTSTLTQIANTSTGGSSNLTNQPVYASGDGSYMTIFIHSGSGGSAQFAVFERFYDTQGNTTGSGFHMVGINNALREVYSQATYYGQTPPVRSTVVLPCTLPTRSNLFYNGSLLLGTIYPFIGKPLNPSPNILLGNSTTFAADYQSVSYKMYGTTRNYIVGSAAYITIYTAMINTDTNLRYLLRYDV